MFADRAPGRVFVRDSVCVRDERRGGDGFGECTECFVVVFKMAT